MTATTPTSTEHHATGFGNRGQQMSAYLAGAQAAHAARA